MRKGIRTWLSIVACLALAFGAWAEERPPNLSTQSGASWTQLNASEQRLLISGILLGAQYVAEKYDRLNRPQEPVTSYMSHLFFVGNDEIRMTLDRIYSYQRYWQVPIIKLIFEYKLVLEELKNGDPIQTVK